MEVDHQAEKIKKAIKFKEEGNKYFKEKNYVKAIEQYSLAINNNAKDASYFGNRAVCYLNLKKYNKCIEDCN